MTPELRGALLDVISDYSECSWDAYQTNVETIINWEGFVHSVDSFGLTYESIGWWLYWGWQSSTDNFRMSAPFIWSASDVLEKSRRDL